MTANKRIAIIEPDDLIREVMQHCLREAGYRTLIANDDDAACGDSNLIILSVPTPARSGSRLRALQRHGVPILLMSARFRAGLQSSRTAARRFGVRGVLPKPFTRKQLLAAVGAAMSGD